MINISHNSVKAQIDEQSLVSLQMVASPGMARIAFRWLAGIFVGVILLMFLPWQQNISGKGYVSTLLPQDRPQNIQNAVAGQISKWLVREGQWVNQGDTLVVLSEIKDDYFDPQVLVRTNEQIVAKNTAIEAYDNKIRAIDDQIALLRQGLTLSLRKAKNKLEQAQMKVSSDSADLVAVQKNFQINQDRLKRGENMLKDGAVSLVEVESRRLKVQEEQAKTVAQRQKFDIARNELVNARVELNSIQTDYEKDIAKAQSDRNSVVSTSAEGFSELSKLKNKYQNIKIRRDLYVIRAPQTGFVVKTLRAGIGETVKEGESLATLQPDIKELAVALYIKAMDLSIARPNQHVRLEFDGWPALQFSGWPGSSVGTFGGRVAAIDRVSSDNGYYRLLVIPDHQGYENEKWPQELRIGSGVNGFVMLKDVPIWWEIWRQLNGFPPDYLDDIKPAAPKKK